MRCRSILADQDSAVEQKGGKKSKTDQGIGVPVSGWVSQTSPDGTPTMEPVDEDAEKVSLKVGRKKVEQASHCTCGLEFQQDSELFCSKCGARREEVGPVPEADDVAQEP